MKTVRFLMVAGLIIASLLPGAASASSSAALFLQPLLSDVDCDAVPDISGEWDGDDAHFDGPITIQKVDNCRYRFLWRARDAESDADGFEVRVGNLDGHVFFDAISQPIRPDGSELFAKEWFWIPLHFIGRLEIEKNVLRLSFVDDNWMTDSLTSGRICMTTILYLGEFVIPTASSKELKEFVTRFASDAQTFSFEVTLERKLK